MLTKTGRARAGQATATCASIAISSATSSCSTTCSAPGVYFHPNQFEPMFLSTAHTPADIAEVSGSVGTRSAKVSGTLIGTDILSPAPILDAAERYRGTIVDLDAACVLGPDEFAKAREALAVWLRQQSAGSRRPGGAGHCQRAAVHRHAGGDSGLRGLAAGGPLQDAAGRVAALRPAVRRPVSGRRARRRAGRRPEIETDDGPHAVCRRAAARLEHARASAMRPRRAPSCGACRCIPRRARPACRRSRCGRDSRRSRKPGITPRRCRSTPTTRFWPFRR